MGHLVFRNIAYWMDSSMSWKRWNQRSQPAFLLVMAQRGSFASRLSTDHWENAIDSMVSESWSHGGANSAVVLWP